MAEALVKEIISLFGQNLSKELIVFITSLLPILELRGGILAGYALGMELLPTFVIAYIGNILPVPFILIFIELIFNLLRETPLRGFVFWCEKKAMSKKSIIDKYAYLGVFLFVAIPLPGTGAWTGSLIASMLKMNKKLSFLYIALGVFTAGIIMSLFSFGLLDVILK